MAAPGPPLLLKMVRDGIIYALVLAGLAAFAVAVGGVVWAVPFLLLAGFVLYFFRDPERIIPAAGVVSPADGKVVEVRQAQWDGQPAWKISIFLSVFDVHVNRSPVSGVIRAVRYTPGRFLVASKPAASVENEQNTVTVETEDGMVVFKQIAGLLARRIVFHKKTGDRVDRGERVGLIQFGSRVDLFLPPAMRPLVAPGNRVRAGSSVLAETGTASGRPAAGAAAADFVAAASGSRPH